MTSPADRPIRPDDPMPPLGLFNALPGKDIVVPVTCRWCARDVKTLGTVVFCPYCDKTDLMTTPRQEGTE